MTRFAESLDQPGAFSKKYSVMNLKDQHKGDIADSIED